MGSYQDTFKLKKASALKETQKCVTLWTGLRVWTKEDKIGYVTAKSCSIPTCLPVGHSGGTCTQQGQCQYGTKNKGTHTWVCLGPHKRFLLADCEYIFHWLPENCMLLANEYTTSILTWSELHELTRFSLQQTYIESSYYFSHLSFASFWTLSETVFLNTLIRCVVSWKR